MNENLLITQIQLVPATIRLQELDENWKTSRFRQKLTSIPYGRIYFPLEGEGFVNFGETHLHLRPGFIYLIPPFVATDVCCPTRLVKYWMHFNALLSGTQLDLFNIVKCSYELQAEHPDYLRALFDALIRLAPKPAAGLELSGLELIEAQGAMTGILAPFYHSIIDENNTPSKRRLLKVQQYIEQHLSENISLEELAETAHLTPSYLSNLFAKQFGLPIIRYCNCRRIAMAQRLLREEEYSVKEISAKTGSANPLTFARLFRRHTGMSPVEYRQKIREEQEKTPFVLP